MDKEKFLNILKSLKLNEVKENEYESCLGIGIKHAFNHLTEEEARFASHYVIRYPHIYYNRYVKCFYGVEAFKKIDNYTDEIRNLIWEYHRHFYHQYVGPFFIFGDEIKGLRIDLTEGNIKDDFIDSPVSHFDYLDFLGIDDDYGHHPRGRVIYNSKTNEFYLYIDKDYQTNKEILDLVKKRFNLNDYNTVVRVDEQYTHDDL